MLNLYLYNFLKKKNKLLFVQYDYKEKTVNSSKCEYEYESAINYEIQIFDTFVFENFFNYSEDYPENEPHKKYSNEYSLGTHFGQINISKIHASRNVAFGQMGNTSIEVYVNNNKDEILVVEEKYIWDEDQGEFAAEDLLEEVGYKKVGSIGLTVWRWMAGNKSDLEKYEYSSPKYNKRYDNPVEVKDIKHGIWEVTHFFGTNDHNKLKINDITIASVLKLKKG